MRSLYRRISRTAMAIVFSVSSAETIPEYNTFVDPGFAGLSKNKLVEEFGIEDDAAFVAHDIIIVVSIQRVCELRLQPRVTHADGERVGVIIDVEQLGDAGL